MWLCVCVCVGLQLASSFCEKTCNKWSARILLVILQSPFYSTFGRWASHHGADSIVLFSKINPTKARTPMCLSFVPNSGRANISIWILNYLTINRTRRTFTRPSTNQIYCIPLHWQCSASISKNEIKSRTKIVRSIRLDLCEIWSASPRAHMCVALESRRNQKIYIYIVFLIKNVYSLF